MASLSHFHSPRQRTHSGKRGYVHHKVKVHSVTVTECTFHAPSSVHGLLGKDGCCNPFLEQTQRRHMLDKDMERA